MTYTEANEKLQGRNHTRRKIGNNTYLERHEDYIAVRLHATDILLYYPDGRIELNSGGWRTVTTKSRMNEYLEGYGIVQERGQWFIVKKGSELRDGDTWPTSKRVALFADGAILHPDGAVTGAEPLTALSDKNKLRRQVQHYASEYIKAFKAGEVAKPGAGDCFYCGMRTADVPQTTGAVKSVSATPNGKGVPVGEVFGDKDHLLSHIEEKYYVPSLLARAFEVMPHSPAMGWALAKAWGDDTTKVPAPPDFIYGQLQKSLSRYILRQLGQAA